ncbi:MAG: acetylxylan esterase [Deltaproteobacteria bacterium]|nr:acetylxylan esterase [Deltaproteobacteria bacterium]
MTVDAKGKVPRVMRSLLFFFLCLAVLLGAEITASLVQRDFGRVDVENVRYPNFNGITIRAKLLKPSGASPLSPLPGAVYIHGYQNNRETGDAYCLELARRGFVVLNIDAIGRGNSGIPNDPKAPDFDPTYGGRTSLEYLRSLPFVRFFHLNGLLSWLYLPLIFIPSCSGSPMDWNIYWNGYSSWTFGSFSPLPAILPLTGPWLPCGTCPSW